MRAVFHCLFKMWNTESYLTFCLNLTGTNQCLQDLHGQYMSSSLGAKDSVCIWFTAVEIFNQSCTVASEGQKGALVSSRL